MRILAIETATATGSIALLEGSTLLVEARAPVPMRQLEWLAPAIAKVLADQDLTPAAVQGLGVSQGPGTFTGLRVGISTAAAWAHALSIPVVGIPTLEVLAFSVQTQGLVCPMLDVRRGEVAAALFSHGDGLTRVMEDIVGSFDQVLEVLPANRPVTFAGDALERYGERLHHLWGSRALIAPRAQWSPRAAAVGQLAAPRLLSGERDDPLMLLPIYPRPAAVTPSPRRVP